MKEIKEHQLWDINALMDKYPILFPTVGTVRNMIRFRSIPVVQFVKNGRIYFDPEEIKRWIKEHSIKEVNK